MDRQPSEIDPAMQHVKEFNDDVSLLIGIVGRYASLKDLEDLRETVNTFYMKGLVSALIDRR